MDALWRDANGNGYGYVVVSVQGASRFAVYDRGGDNTFLGSFAIGPSADADAVQGTEGIDIVQRTSARLIRRAARRAR